MLADLVLAKAYQGALLYLCAVLVAEMMGPVDMALAMVVMNIMRYCPGMMEVAGKVACASSLMIVLRMDMWVKRMEPYDQVQGCQQGGNSIIFLGNKGPKHIGYAVSGRQGQRCLLHRCLGLLTYNIAVYLLYIKGNRPKGRNSMLLLEKGVAEQQGRVEGLWRTKAVPGITLVHIGEIREFRCLHLFRCSEAHQLQAIGQHRLNALAKTEAGRCELLILSDYLMLTIKGMEIASQLN